jgi:hypothetical protein
MLPRASESQLESTSPSSYIILSSVSYAEPRVGNEVPKY